jgi:hypothetical protein
MAADLIVEMENPPKFKNLPHTFNDGKGTWVVRFQTTSGTHCVAGPPDPAWSVTGDLTITPQGFKAISEDDETNFQDVTITGTQGTWNFRCCVHFDIMKGMISVEPPKEKPKY